MAFQTTLKTQKIISAVAIAFVVPAGFEICAYILNLNQSAIFLEVALAVYAYLFIKISLLYDLHFKNPGALGRARIRHENMPQRVFRALRVFFSAAGDRFSHMARWSGMRQLLNYLLLPGLIFWATIDIIYLNFGDLKIQQLFILLSSIALVFLYWNLKEIFYRKREKVDWDIFAVLSVVKLYTAFLLLSASIGTARRFCLSSDLLVLGVFALMFLLIYQALFQHNSIKLSNINYALCIAAVMAVAAYEVLRFWGFNYFTAGIFLTSVYNMLWGIFHARLDKVLTVRVVLEHLIISLLIITMVLSATNFQAKILDSCSF